MLHWNTLRSLARDFPGGPVVKNLPSNAGDTGSIPGQGTKIPHAMGQISSPRHNYWVCVPQLESPCAANYRAHVPWSLCTTTREKPVCCNENERSRVSQRGSRVLQLRPDTAKNNRKIKKRSLTYWKCIHSHLVLNCRMNQINSTLIIFRKVLIWWKSDIFECDYGIDW